MMPEQQQRILGYFIEEAKDHLNTIEQGLLNLQSTIQDPEMVTEVFRAAHSVKGGAAMLSLGSIQQTSHRLEDYFKVLKEAPTTQVDRDLETMFLQVFDGLQALLEELQGPFGLTDDKAQEVMADIEPVFGRLESHLNALVAVAPAVAPAAAPTATATATPPLARATASSEDSALKLVFSSDVPSHLREMLTLFKQTDTEASRTALQGCCDALKREGEQFDLSLWSELPVAARQAVGNVEQTYRSLAPVVIKELKRAQEQVLSGQANAILIAAELESLMPLLADTDDALGDIDSLLDDALSPMEAPELTDLFATETEPAPTAEADLDWLDLPSTTEETAAGDTSDDFAASLSALTSEPAESDAPREPTVGTAELNSLADLFEGEVAELDSPWEEISESEAAIADPPISAIDLDSDFSDLLDGAPEEDDTHSSNDLADLFGDPITDEAPTISPPADTDDDLDDLLNLDVTPRDSAATSPDTDDVGLDSLLDSLESKPASDAEIATDLDLGLDETSDTIDFDLDLEAAPEGEAGVSDFGDLFNTEETISVPTSEPDRSLPSEAAADTDFGDLFGAAAATEIAAAPVGELEDALSSTADDLANIPESITVSESTSELVEAGDEPTLETVDEDIDTSFDAIDDPWSTDKTDTTTAENETSALDALDELWTETEVPSPEATDSAEQNFNDFPAVDVEDQDIESPEIASIAATTEDFDDLFADSDEAETTSDLGLTLDDSEVFLDVPVSTDAAADVTDTSFDDLLLDSNTSAAVEDGIETELDDLWGENTVTADAGTTDADLDFLTSSDASPSSTETPETTDVDNRLAVTGNVSHDADLRNSTDEVDTDDFGTLLGDAANAALPLTEEIEHNNGNDFDLTFADAGDEVLALASDTSEAAAMSTDDFEAGLPDDTSDDLFAEADTGLPDTSDDLFAEADAELADNSTSAIDDITTDFFGSDDGAESSNVIASSTSDDIDDFFSTPTEAVAAPTAASTDLAESAAALDPFDEITAPALDLVADSELNDSHPASAEADTSASDAIAMADELDALAADNADLTDELSDFDFDLSNPDATILEPEPEANSLFDTPEQVASSIEADLGLDELDFDLSVTDEPPEAIATTTESYETQNDADRGLDELDFGLGDIDEDAAIAASHDAQNDVDRGLDELDFDLGATAAAAEAVDPITASHETQEDAGLELDELDFDLGETSEVAETAAAIAEPDEIDIDEASDFGELDAMLADSTASVPADTPGLNASATDISEFDELDDLLSEPPAEANVATTTTDSGVDFDELDALIGDDSTEAVADAETSSEAGEDEFGDLEKLLEEADQTMGGAASSIRSPGPSRSTRRVSGIVDQTMRVSVKHLDNLNNLVGELVVNRNSLEQDQDRFRQFLDNLLFQVQQLNDVGQRMRDLYERSLLESSLLASRQAFQAGGSRLSSVNNSSNGDSHATGASFDALEMDRFTGFHTLTQEMIELIVRVRESSSDIAYTVESTDQIARQFRQVTTQLQEGLNKARMVPFAQTADRLPRAVRDISIKCGKEARLVVEGRDTLIDKMLLERLYDPMTHLVNNAITHGIESPEERAALGKPREGKIMVRAFYQGNQTVIYIEDDGGGINPNVIKRKAIQKGLITQAEAERMNTLETYELIFHHGFTTRDQADDFAGRGVGMDVVRTALSEIRGSISIDSELGKGTSFTIRLPLTLSISKALSCLNNQARIAFPMDGVEDMFDVPGDRVQTNDKNQSYIQWRDMALTFQPLSELLQFNRSLGRGRVYGGNQDDDMVSIVVLRNANTYIGIQVDRVLGEQEIVIKQIEGPVPKPMGIAGATVLGDGRVMPIGDVLELIDIAQGRVRREAGSSLWSQVELPPEEEQEPVKSEPTVLIVDDSITVRELLSMSFNKVGYRVEQARDGQEAWEKMRSGLPCDLVFCDIEMPRMDGLELLSRMQKDNMLKNIPIAMLTSRGADRHRQMAVDLGASGYFTKPYLEEALLEAAQRMLQGEVLIGATAEEAE